MKCLIRLCSPSNWSPEFAGSIGGPTIFRGPPLGVPLGGPFFGESLTRYILTGYHRFWKASTFESTDRLGFLTKHMHIIMPFSYTSLALSTKPLPVKRSPNIMKSLVNMKHNEVHVKPLINECRMWPSRIMKRRCMYGNPIFKHRQSLSFMILLIFPIHREI